MKIGAILPQTLIDYPGKVSAVFFAIGCNFKCPHCYNTDLSLSKLKPLPDKKLNDFLEERKGFINAVIFSGGEPTLQKDLFEFIKKTKKHGLSVGLETNGSNPQIIKKLIQNNLLDFIAMDVKTDIENYDKSAGVKVNKKDILTSIELLKNSEIKHEFRITMVPNLVKKTNIKKIGELIKGSPVVLQQFVNDKEMIDNKLKKLIPYNSKELEEFKKILSKYSPDVKIRRA